MSKNHSRIGSTVSENVERASLTSSQPACRRFNGAEELSLEETAAHQRSLNAPLCPHGAKNSYHPTAVLEVTTGS